MYIGIDIGGTKCAVLQGDDQGQILQKIKFPTTTCHETLERILDAVASLGACRAIGISCGGPLDEEAGLILSPPNLPGWDQIPITAMLRERFGVPVYLCNDANACALAEWKFGAGQGTKNMVFLTFGTGLGAGLILDGKLYRGTNGNAGEVGHIRLAPKGPVGYGKAGSFEGFCSGGGIKQIGQALVRQALAANTPPTICPTEDGIAAIDARLLAEAADAGDPLAREAYTLSAKHLGMGLSILIDILNPEAIVIGSVFTRSRHLFEEELMRVIRQEALAPSAAVCRILPATLGDSIGDYAALAVAMGEDRYE